jgi:hypothetical protein
MKTHRSLLLSVSAWALLSGLAACGGANAASGTATQPTASSASSSAPMTTADWAAKAASDNAAANKGASSPEPSVPEWTSAGGFDAKGWMKERGISGELPADANCEAAQVGKPVVEALSCDVHLEVQVARPWVQANPDEPPTVIPPTLQFRRMIFVGAGGALRKVFDVPIEAGPLHPVTKDPDANAFARLQVELDPTGAKLSVVDDPEFSCERARKKEKELATDPDTAETASWLKKAVDPVCAARGNYHWRNGAFHKAAGGKK